MLDTRQFRRGLILAQVLILVCGLAAPWRAGAQDERNVPAPRRGFEQVQIEALADGDAFLMWGRPVPGGHDLLGAVRGAEGTLFEARRLNREPGGARILARDEARPALATDGGDRIGVAWFDADGRLYATRSDDRGASFARPVRLDDGEGRPEHAFVNAGFDPDGGLHVVWLDAREADPGMEEPAQVFHVAWTSRGVREPTNVTLGHFESVCGCCRPFVVADRFGVEVTFRGIEDRHRDVYRVLRDRDGDWGTPERIGPPLWEIAACPMAGPISDGRSVLWRDGSGPRDRIVEGTSAIASVREIVEPDERGVGMSSPRWIDPEFVLVPGRPSGWLLRHEGGTWEVARSDVPAWCSDMLRIRDQMLMVGDQEGNLEVQALDLAP